uniref:Uncharacterized protein n=1 Tax=Chromera velia CCMP2878 TaxID=1169474 RepID=A0A0G4G3M9_9ALVE|eukprot:Cvel_20121.t1-p1 / transcript=Cvel_20121.t1 / gene=Cvel_20121 / organism=Chromera_velia_CCMP2878 / gene_product=hypothetical protein / transcript_product=hypothetical protein / location=Cvel_scaffold1784:11376-18338(+) / protein_length=941 / sequence_SO=supercontig / SO=protein_coding / is_pseudo=false
MAPKAAAKGKPKTAAAGKGAGKAQKPATGKKTEDGDKQEKSGLAAAAGASQAETTQARAGRLPPIDAKAIEEKPQFSRHAAKLLASKLVSEYDNTRLVSEEDFIPPVLLEPPPEAPPVLSKWTPPDWSEVVRCAMPVRSRDGSLGGSVRVQMDDRGLLTLPPLSCAKVPHVPGGPPAFFSFKAGEKHLEKKQKKKEKEAAKKKKKAEEQMLLEEGDEGDLERDSNAPPLPASPLPDPSEHPVIHVQIEGEGEGAEGEEEGETAGGASVVPEGEGQAAAAAAAAAAAVEVDPEPPAPILGDLGFLLHVGEVGVSAAAFGPLTVFRFPGHVPEADAEGEKEGQQEDEETATETKKAKKGRSRGKKKSEATITEEGDEEPKAPKRRRRSLPPPAPERQPEELYHAFSVLALSCPGPGPAFHQVSNIYRGPGTIQLWQVWDEGDMATAEGAAGQGAEVLQPPPRLVMCIRHAGHTVWDLKWVRFSASLDLGRAGILGGVLADGSCLIWAVPLAPFVFPSSNNPGGGSAASSGNIPEPVPCVELKPVWTSPPHLEVLCMDFFPGYPCDELLLGLFDGRTLLCSIGTDRVVEEGEEEEGDAEVTAGGNSAGEIVQMMRSFRTEGVSLPVHCVSWCPTPAPLLFACADAQSNLHLWDRREEGREPLLSVRCADYSVLLPRGIFWPPAIGALFGACGDLVEVMALHLNRKTFKGSTVSKCRKIPYALAGDCSATGVAGASSLVFTGFSDGSLFVQDFSRFAAIKKPRGLLMFRWTAEECQEERGGEEMEVQGAAAAGGQTGDRRGLPAAAESSSSSSSSRAARAAAPPQAGVSSSSSSAPAGGRVGSALFVELFNDDERKAVVRRWEQHTEEMRRHQVFRATSCSTFGKGLDVDTSVPPGLGVSAVTALDPVVERKWRGGPLVAYGLGTGLVHLLATKKAGLLAGGPTG